MTPQATLGLNNAFAYDGLAMTIDRRVGEANSTETRHFITGNQFAIEMDAFATALRTNTVPRTPGEEGLQDMKLIAAIYQAAAGGGAVSLPEIAGIDAFRGPLPAVPPA